MAKFCSKCGKELKTNETCSCEKKVERKKESKKKEEVVVEAPVSTQMFQTFTNVVKGIFTKPIDTIQTYSVSENFTFGMIMILINCIITGLFVFLLGKEIVEVLQEYMGMFQYGMATKEMEVSFSLVIQVAIYMLVGFLCTGGMFYLFAGPVLKTDIGWKKIFALIGVCSVLTSITTLLVIVFMYMSMTLAIILLILSGILYLSHLYHGFMEISSVDSNRLGYVFVSTIAVASFFVLYIMPKIFS